MIITYYGLSCFKIQSGETTLAIDPYERSSGLTPPRFQTNIALSTSSESNHSNAESLSGDPFIISDPGEYELKGILIEGIPISPKHGIFMFEWEGIRLCHLGALPKKSLTDKIREAIGTPDVLFVPIGGGSSLDADEAATIVSRIEPRIIIPMYYKIPGLSSPDLENPDTFIKEFSEGEKPLDKFTFKKKDLPQEETKLILLEPSAGK